MDKATIILAQKLLQRDNLYHGRVDGIFGYKSTMALSSVRELNNYSDPHRKLIAYLQSKAIGVGINPGPIDGYYGPMTEHAIDQLDYYLGNNKLMPCWRPEDIERPSYPKQYSQDFYDYYGRIENMPGSNLVNVSCPFPLKIAWNVSQTITRFKAHKKIASEIEKILNEVVDTYGLDEIQRLRLDQFGGCYNKRPIRGGKSWSMHSWGCGIDWDPVNNRLRWNKDRASFAHPDYDLWWEIWEKYGWTSLGRQKDFDWMHVQAASL